MVITRLISRLAIASRFGGPAQRFFCSPPPSKPKIGLMDFPLIHWPSIIQSAKNWVFTTFIIKPHLDPTFEIMEFIEGSKQAVEIISTAMSESDFSSLQELVSPDIYDQLCTSISEMSLGSRENLAIRKQDIYAAFPYQIGIMFEEDERRWVEITMCYHALRGIRELEKSEMNPLGLGFDPSIREKINICNYRFIREYTKDVTDSSWLVNIVNHFKEADLTRK